MIRFTTPTHAHRVKGIDLTGCDVWVSYEQGLANVNVKAAAVEYDGQDTVVTVPLTQLQTARFKDGRAMVQINWIHPDGKRNAVRPKEMKIVGNLLKKAVGYGD